MVDDESGFDQLGTDLGIAERRLEDAPDVLGDLGRTGRRPRPRGQRKQLTVTVGCQVWAHPVSGEIAGRAAGPELLRPDCSRLMFIMNVGLRRGRVNSVTKMAARPPRTFPGKRRLT